VPLNLNEEMLDKSSLFKLLNNRFCDGHKKLSQIPNPNLLQDAQKAAKKIVQSIKENKKITVVGDYDVDGVVSTAIMADFFKQIPYPLETVIPNRFNDGYGVSPNILNRIETDLIITVDNGISAFEAAEICKERNIDLIITDHHTPAELLPEAFCIVNPKLSKCTYPFKEICGAQVAWLLLALVKKELNLNVSMEKFLDILAIAIIADIMPLIDINRTLVKEGLKVLMTSTRPASIIIRDFLNKSSITSEDIAFQIAPRINSAGRLKDATISLKFFLASSTHEAYKFFEELNTLNEQRKETEAKTTKEALKKANKDDKVIVVAKEDWHEGVVGIVAARVVDHFCKPAIILSIKDSIAKGSARSIGNVNIYNLIKENKHFLNKFGGHKMAAGLGLDADNLDNFRNAINKSASKLSNDDFIPKEKIAGIFKCSEIDYELLNILENFEPYGEANSRPKFFIKDAQIINIKTFGRDKSHSKITLKQFPTDKKTIELIAFKKVLKIPTNKKISCSYSVTKNEFNLKISIQLIINKIY